MKPSKLLPESLRIAGGRTEKDDREPENPRAREKLLMQADNPLPKSAPTRILGDPKPAKPHQVRHCLSRPDVVV
jgi:hypothetical protein